MIPLVRRIAFGAMMAVACACASSIAIAGPAAAAAPSPTASPGSAGPPLTAPPPTPPPVTAPPPAAASPIRETLHVPKVTLAYLRWLVSKLSGASRAVIVVDGRSDLDGYPATSLSQAWSQVIGQLGRYSFTVVVERPEPTGTAGSLLYALATERVVASGATLTPLPKELTQGTSPACSKKLCTSLARADIRVSAGSSPEAPGSPVVTAAAPASGGGSTWLLIALVVVAAVAVWLAGGRRVIQRMTTRQPGGLGSPAVEPAIGPAGPPRQPAGTPGPAGRPAPRPWPAGRAGPVANAARHGPGQGIVRTVMSPEGYVEIDGVLYRATWRGSRDAPLRGAVVAIRRDQYGDLVAVDGGPGRNGPG